MNIVQKLSLNKHPKDVPDLSLVMAQNIKISNDESCITNEEGIRENTYIKTFLENHYNKSYKILGIIPCNNELVIIASAIDNISSASIFRYRENTAITSENMKCVYDKLIYNGGKYTGTFTYNVEESLILALSEYDVKEENIPLKVINLGNFNDESISNDINLKDEQLSLIPEVKLPTLTNYNITKGRSYKGIYYLFIRYKINTTDYTQWYNFGNPIHIDEINIKNIIREYHYERDENNTALYHSFVVGISDYFSDDIDIVNNSFNINIENIDNNYQTYQLGFICSTKSYTKVWRTEDINATINNYTLDIKYLIESSVTEFITPYYNYYNVKKLINYKNRLYISNYYENETDINDTNLQDNTKNVSLSLYGYYNENPSEIDSYNTLIPDGVYNFFIHYIDKYGHATKGYKIDPPKNLYKENEYSTIIPIEYNNSTHYWIVPANLKISEIVTITTENIKFASSISNNIPVLIYITQNEINDLFKDQYDHIYNNEIHRKLYVSQLFNGAVQLNNTSSHPVDAHPYLFGVTYNSNGDYLWRVPNRQADVLDDYSEGGVIHPYRYRLNVQLSNIPNKYIGYYISYEKYEPNALATGFLTYRNANVSGRAIDENGHKILNKNIINKSTTTEYKEIMCFYSSQFDISDSININYNTLFINSKKRGSVKHYESYKTKSKDIEFPTNAIFEEYYKTSEKYNKLYPMPNFKLAIANDVTNGRSGIGTCLLIDDDYELFKDNMYPASEYNNPNTKISTYIATLYNFNNNIYTNKNKKLIRLSDYIYDTNIHSLNYYNGCFNVDGVLIYNANGYTINLNTDNNAYKSATIKGGNNIYFLDNPNYDSLLPASVYGVNYVKFVVYSDTVLSSKVFNNKPKLGYNFIEPIDKQNAAKELSSIVEPINSVDLFKNPQGSVDDFYPITNTNYREDLVNIIQFDKTVRRSNVIQDETRVNAWRQFPIEGYKNITENKGKITNLVGIGSLFLVHTEHSLFMFDTGNTLEAVDQSIQLAQPDAFEVTYKEVFTSDLGFGGLQDKESAIIDQFGYIFYNNDSNRLYRFDNKQLAMIDDDIVEWLLRNKPYNVRFANDKQNNRLLIKFEYGYNQYSVLSYNYNIKNFISTHSYYFDKAYNTKINLYLRCDDNHNNCSLHQFIKNKNNYCSFDNVKTNLGEIINQDSKLSIIVNPSFEIIKYLEYFNYKLSKIADVDKVSLTNLPVEGTITPFSGNKLKVYNDLTNTGELDINVNEEISKNIFANFDKPYWHLGVWNYSYLRNKINTYPSTKNPDVLSRIIGNYFIIEFTFDNSDNKLIEFEGLNYKVIR